MLVKILSEAIHHFLISPSKLDEWDYEHYFYPDNLFNISHVIKRSIQRVTPENITCVCQLFLLCRKQFSYREQWQFWRQAFRLETIKIFSCLIHWNIWTHFLNLDFRSWMQFTIWIRNKKSKHSSSSLIYCRISRIQSMRETVLCIRPTSR